MLCSYLYGIVRILVRDLIQINGFFSFFAPSPNPSPLTTYSSTMLRLSFKQNLGNAFFFLLLIWMKQDFLCVFFGIICFTVYWNLIIKKEFINWKNPYLYIQLLITYSIVKIALTIHFKISLYPSVLHYTKWNWAYSWNIIRGHLDFFMSCVDFFCCKILIKIFLYFLSFSTRKKFPEWIYIEYD